MPSNSTALRYTLYHTDGCHLCELAYAIIVPLMQQAELEFDYIDICDSPELASLYGTSIPVFSNGEQIIQWPFDEADVQQFLGV